MPIDPSIALQAQTPSLLQAISGGLQVGDEIRTRGLRDMLLQAQIAQASRSGASSKGFAPVAGVDASGNQTYVGMVFDPATGSYTAQSIAPPEGITLNVETPGEKLARDIAEAQAKADIKSRSTVDQERGIQQVQTQAAAGKKAEEVRGKSIEERRQGAIAVGLDGAKAIPTIRRSLDLLNSVSTGGYDALALRAKQLFGVEGANEAELSANLGKTVLSQLRPIFGAQFTQEEGKRLERIEAGFGKSTEGNKALLRQSLQIFESAAKRGIKAAEDAADYRTAEEIQEFLDFQIDPSEFQGEKPGWGIQRIE